MFIYLVVLQYLSAKNSATHLDFHHIDLCI